MKNMKGITLIALVITIVVLIILAGVAISLSLGENGIFNKAKFATEEYKNAEDYEEEKVAEMVNQIDKHTANTRENDDTNPLEGSQIKTLVSLYDESLKGANMTYNMSIFAKTPTDDMANYLEEDTTNNCYIVKKSGWYIIEMFVGISQTSNTPSRVFMDMYINGIERGSCNAMQRNGYNHNDENMTLYLSKDTKLSFGIRMTNNANDHFAYCGARISVMD